MDSLLQDLRYAFRSLRRTPGFALTVIVVMALGIGVNSMIYTVVRGIMFSPLPFPDVERLVTVEALNRKQGGEPNEMSLADVRDVQARSRTLQHVSVWLEQNVFVNTGQETERFQTTVASSDLASALGVTPQLGRWFTPAECQPGGYLTVAVLGDKVWRERFGADRNIIGQPIRVSGRTRTVVGVMPPGFRFPEVADFFLPFNVADTSNSRGARYISAAGRLAAGASLAAANAELGALSASIAKESPGTNRDVRFVSREYREQLRSDMRVTLTVLLLAVTFVLLIGCANVANLMLARAASRVREVGVRVALGATRGRLVRQMVTESVLLAAAGGGLGVLLGQWGLDVTLASIPVELPYWMKMKLDPQVILAVAAVSMFAGIAAGLAPALQASGGDVLTPLREGTPGGGDSRSRRRLRSMLLEGEFALSVVLLIASGLMIRSFLRLTEQRHALRATGVLTGSVTLPVALYEGDDARVNFFRELRGTLMALPGVKGAGAALNLHLGRSRWTMSVQREGLDTDPDAENAPQPTFNVITPGYLDAVGLQLIRGRDFNDADGPQSLRVALVNDVAARELWPGREAIGQRFRFSSKDSSWTTVVGVIGTVRQHAKMQDRSLAEVILPHAQYGNQTLLWAVRSDAPMGAMAAMVRKAVRERDPNLAFSDARSLDAHVARATWDTRIYAQLMGVFGLIALVIAALGIYGVMAYSVAQRTREIGIRMALGAARADVQRLVLGHAVQLTLLGSGIGLALAFAVTRFMSGLLFGVRPDDPPTFVGVTLILALSSAAAAWLPTARAVRVDPIVALRHE